MRVRLGALVFVAVLQFLAASAHSACRDPEVARRGVTSLAYAANVDATIQYFGHNFFLITTSKGTRIVTDPLGPGWYPNPNVFGEITSGLRLDPGETRSIEVVQTGEQDPLVLASQSESVNIRFESSSPEPGIGEIEFRFTIHVVAHKETPGTGAGTLIFY